MKRDKKGRIQMSFTKFKNSLLGKIVSLTLVAAFSLYNCDIGAAMTETDLKTPEVMPDAAPFCIDDIGIAIDVGTVRSSFRGNSGKTIVHIQDAHCNFEAQSNISRILEQLSREAGIDMISVEGAEGTVDTAWFRAFPDAEIRREVATYFMRKGEITGAEFFSINSDYNGTIFGAETRDYYVENLRAFLDVFPYKDSIQSYLEDLRTVGERLKSIIYPPLLRELDRNKMAFEGRDMDLSDYVEYLSDSAAANRVDVRSYENFRKLIDTLEYEKKIDFDIVDGERTRYIDALSEILSREEMAELVEQSVRFKKGYIKTVDFYTYLRELAREHNIPIIREYPNLFYYYIYSRIYDGIEIEGLFREIDLVERGLKEKFIENETQYKLDKYAEKVGKIISLVNIEMTNDDYDRFSTYSDAFTIDDVVSFFGSMVRRYNLNYSIGQVPMVVRENLPKMVDFYEIAMARDRALVENTLAQMEREGKNESVLIAGGFHTRGMVNLLEKKGVSYVVVTPKITKDVESPYIQVLTNQRTSIEDIITDSAAMPGTQRSSGDLLAVPSFVGWLISSGIDVREIFRKMGEDEIAQGYLDLLEKVIQEIPTEASEIYVETEMNRIVEGMETDLGMTRFEARDKFEGWLRDEEMWKWLKSVFISRYVSNYASDNLEPRDTIVEIMGRKFDKYRAEYLGTPGEQAAGEVLTEAQARRFNEVLRESFAAGNAREEIVAGLEDRPEFKFIVHDGLADRLRRAGLPVNVHPGRGGSEFGHGLLQAHIDSSVYAELRDAEKLVLARHELAHLDIFNADESNETYQAWIAAGSPTGEAQERFVNRTLGHDVRPIMARLGDVAAMEEILLEDTSFGTAVRDHILSARDDMKALGMVEPWYKPSRDAIIRDMQEDLEKFIRETYTRRVNVDHMRELLTAETYTGYDVIIVSSSFEAEVERQQEDLDRLFAGRTTDNDALGNKVCVLSVLDESEGGQIIGQMNTWRRAVEAYREWAEENNAPVPDLDELLAEGNAKIAVYHNGGKGERSSPAPQAIGSRGAQKTIGEMPNALGDIVQMRLINSIVMQTAPLAVSNDGSRVDTFWANQIAFGTTDFSGLERTGYHFDKFVVKVPQDPNKKDLFDYGTAIIDKAGRIVKFLANQVLTVKGDKPGAFVDNPDFATEMQELMEAPKGVFDFGSFSMSREMHDALMDYWGRVRGIFDVIDSSPDHKAGIKRDIDPALVQVIVPLAKGLEGIDIPSDVLPDRERILPHTDLYWEDQMDAVYHGLVGLMTDEDARNALNKIYNDRKKKMFVLESVEFFALYRDVIFPDLSRVVGHIDIGENSHWFAYKRMLDLSNEKFIMLADMLGRTQELYATGEVISRKATIADKIRAEDARRMRHIDSGKVASFRLPDGTRVDLTLDQVIAGYTHEEYGIEIRGSIIQGDTVLLPGSIIIDSVVNDSQGVIIAESSYVESSTAPEIQAERSIVYNVSDVEPVAATAEIVADAYRESIRDDRFPEGQTRMRAPIGYDPKETPTNLEKHDKKLFGDNLYTFDDIREIPVARDVDDMIETQIRQRAFFSMIPRQEWVKQFKQLGFGTSGLRDEVVNMTDMEVYINARGYVRFLFEQGHLDAKDENIVSIGMDRRPSSPRLMAAVARAVQDESAKLIEEEKLDYEIQLDLGGEMPTPALAVRAKQKGSFSIMVTGSHIPFDMNGIKFYLADGEEVLKEHEAAIHDSVSSVRSDEYSLSWQDTLFDERAMFKQPVEANYDLSEHQREALETYKQRYIEGFPEGMLEGVKLGFWQHSAVGRDIIAEILRELGAEVVELGRTEEFTPVDTEKITPAMDQTLRGFADRELEDTGRRFDAIIFTDGDSDRPGVADEYGKFLTGDKLGLLATKELLRSIPEGMELRAALPVSTNYGVIEDIRGIQHAEVVKTKIGSPHVVKAMNDEMELARADDREIYTLGWEANGGFLLGSDVRIEGAESHISRLATRDALFPMLLALRSAKEHAQRESETRGLATKMSMSGLFEREIPKVHNHTGGYEGLMHPVRESGFGLERSVAMEVRKGIIDMLMPELSDTDVVSVDFETLTAERMKTAVIGEKTVTLFETETIAVDQTSGDWQEWLRVKSELEKVFTQDRGFAEIRSINIMDGIQVIFKTDEISHLRPSGNDPVFRNYAMSGVSEDRAREIASLGEEVIIPELARAVMASKGMSVPQQEAVPVSSAVSSGVLRLDTATDSTPGIYSATIPAQPSEEVRAVGDLLMEGLPARVVPRKDPKVWGAEYWYGEGAVVEIMDSSGQVHEAPLSEVIRYAPEVLGTAVLENFGTMLPLVKILVAEGRLSVQFHDAKNELWVVTKAEPGAEIIYGFSKDAVERYGDRVTEVFEEALTRYGDSLNLLIDLAEVRGITLDFQGDIRDKAKEYVAQNPQDREMADSVRDLDEALLGIADKDAPETRLAGREGLEWFYGKRPVQAGDIIPIPAGTLHALGKGVEIIEPQIEGDTQPVVDGANYPVRYFFPGHERPGAQRQLDTARVNEIDPIVASPARPDILSETSAARVERMPGTFEAKGLEVHKVTFKGPKTEVTAPDTGSVHNLVVIKGEASIIVDGQETTIPLASPDNPMLIVPATAEPYKIVAEGDTEVLVTFTPKPLTWDFPAPVEWGRDMTLNGETEYDYDVTPRFIEYDTMVDVRDEVGIYGGQVAPLSDVVKGRKHTLRVGERPVEVVMQVSGEVIPLEPGSEMPFAADAPLYEVRNPADVRAVVEVVYDLTPQERIAYETLSAIKKHIPAIQKKRMRVYVPNEMFRSGDRRTPGSLQWTELLLRGITNSDISLMGYTSTAGLDDFASRTVTSEFVEILVASDTNLSDANMLEGAKDFISNVRVLPVPQNALEQGGWDFALETAGWSAILGAVEPEQIQDVGNLTTPAADLHKFLTKVLRKQIEMAHLYLMLPFETTRTFVSGLSEDEQEAVSAIVDTRSLVSYMANLVKEMLFSMPIKAFDPMDALRRRLQVMWSA